MMRYRGWHGAENVLRRTAMAALPEGFRKEDGRLGIREWEEGEVGGYHDPE